MSYNIINKIHYQTNQKMLANIRPWANMLLYRKEFTQLIKTYKTCNKIEIIWINHSHKKLANEDVKSPIIAKCANETDYFSSIKLVALLKRIIHFFVSHYLKFLVCI